MLLLADRGFRGFDLWRAAAATGADLLWRVKNDAVLPVRTLLEDGSYLSEIVAARDKNRRADPIRVRVIEYTLGRDGSGTAYRLITTIHDPKAASAVSLAALYAQRWEIESTLDEIKTHLSARAIPIRSKTPAGVVQEIYGLILAHYVVRRVMHDAAVRASRDSDRLSFLDSLRVLQCQLPESPQVPTETWYQRLLAEVRRQELRPRRDRWYPRVIKRKMSNWMKKRPEHSQPLQPTKPFREAVVLLN